MIDPAAEAAAFEAGLAAGFDPQPDPALGEITTITSWWHTTWCSVCGHTFRRGDRVRVDRRARSVQHLDPSLRCAVAEDRIRTTEDDGQVAEFLAGLLAAWPTGDGATVTGTDEAPHLLAGPRGGIRRPSCLVCGHSFRRDETVLICPCSPDRPSCGAAVHRDPCQGLMCWESWRPGSTVDVCPVWLRDVAELRRLR